jgi:hypothetical protein
MTLTENWEHMPVMTLMILKGRTRVIVSRQSHLQQGQVTHHQGRL